MEAVQAHEHALTRYALEQLRQVRDLDVYGPESEDDRSGVISFNVDRLHPHDVASILDQHGVAIRGGHHCAMPVMDAFGIPGTVRASFGLYNSRADVDALTQAVRKVRSML